jgi:hypothetical protein
VNNKLRVRVPEDDNRRFTGIAIGIRTSRNILSNTGAPIATANFSRTYTIYPYGTVAGRLLREPEPHSNISSCGPTGCRPWASGYGQGDLYCPYRGCAALWRLDQLECWRRRRPSPEATRPDAR